jgi:hypothetical protein
MSFNIHDWQYQRKAQLEEFLKEEDLTFSLDGQSLPFKISFYESQYAGVLNFYYQFIPSTSETLNQIEVIGKNKAIEEIGKFIESKTSLIAPYDPDAPGAGFSFKVLPSELKEYMVTPFK